MILKTYFFLIKLFAFSEREKQAWPCLHKQLLSHWISSCPNYIVSQPRCLCRRVLWHRRSIGVAFSVSAAIFVKSECLLCFSSAPLFVRNAQLLSSAGSQGNWIMPWLKLSLCASRYSVEFIVTFLMDGELSDRFQPIGIFMVPSANRKWQGWQASECGQLSREINVTPYPVKNLFLLL